MTEIGERGINLSGGQKARLSLARAVYKLPDIILLDDPISALDAHVRKAIFHEVFQGIMREKTRILITHAVDFVHLADKIVIMDEGKIDAAGTFEDLQEHPYMKEILEIHNKNKVKLQEQADLDEVAGEDSGKIGLVRKISSHASDRSSISSLKSQQNEAISVKPTRQSSDGSNFMASISGL